MIGYVPRPVPEDTYYLADTPQGIAVLILVTLALAGACLVMGRLFWEHISASIASSNREAELYDARTSERVVIDTEAVDAAMTAGQEAR